MPNKLSQFWQELKRRKVIKAIGMYAGTAFIILEVVDIVSPALLLPSWTLTLVIVILAVGFPIVVILSWIFDLTSEGIKKTESRIRIGIGNIYAGAELIDEAEIQFRQALALDPENPGRMNSLACFLIQNDRAVNEGMDLVRKSLKLNPDHWSALDTYGWGLYKQDSLEESLRILKRSWDLRPIFDQTLYEHLQEVEQVLASQKQ